MAEFWILTVHRIQDAGLMIVLMETFGLALAIIWT
jgi:hypothetical protein